jgi:predicted peptidase
MPSRRSVVAAMLALSTSEPWAARPNIDPGEHTQRFEGVVRRKVRLPYLLWMPEAGQRPAAGWPLVIFLHGSGERGDDLARVKANGPPKYAGAGRRFPFVLVAPQIAADAVWQSDALDALISNLLARLPVDPDRVLITGLSLGGIGAWRYAMDYPQRLAGIAPVCGAGDPGGAPLLVKLPIWAFHGARDDVVPLFTEQRVVDAVNALGGRAKFTVYPDVGHNAWDPAYADEALYDWLLAQRRPRR